MNPLFKQSGITPTAALAHRERESQAMEAYKSAQAAIRAGRNMVGRFENRTGVTHQLSQLAKVNAKKASLGQEVPPQVDRPERWRR